jgi:hypothetical protein
LPEEEEAADDEEEMDDEADEVDASDIEQFSISQK